MTLARCALLSALGTILASPWTPVIAQEAKPTFKVIPGVGTIETPASSQPIPDQPGQPRRAHTNFEIFKPAAKGLPQVRLQKNGVVVPNDYPSNATNETPGSLACVYQVPGGAARQKNQCSPGAGNPNATGGSRVIAIVDAYHDPNALNDLTYFSNFFGLPAPTAATFQVVYATGADGSTPGTTPPPVDSSGGWEGEESLDIEAVHAMAPNATIILVEAASNKLVDLNKAVDLASTLVVAGGGGEVSMSYGGSEYSSEQSQDLHFQKTGVVYFASTGDKAGTEYPAASPYVVSVGGTTIIRDSNTNAFVEQDTWSDGGGGPSPYVAAPTFQAKVSSYSGKMRATPDIAADANPNSGMYVYDSYPYQGVSYGFFVVGGTSLAAPLVAAMTNAAGTFRASSTDELTHIYANPASKQFTLILNGTCGPSNSYAAKSPYNYCTGLGSPLSGRPF